MLTLCLYVFPAISFAFEYPPNYGYAGPACAVADGRLFLHGEAKRELTPSENAAFRYYQRDLSVYLEVKKKFPILEPPKMPSFCGALSDTAELVLAGCIVRDGKVYIDEKEVRSITDEEASKVDDILGPWSRRRRMKKRQTHDVFKEPGFSPLRDISIFLDRFFKINPTVTKRFAPWFEQSPLVSGREPIVRYSPSFNPPTFETSRPPKPLKPGSYGIKRRPTSRWETKNPYKFSENVALLNKSRSTPERKNSLQVTSTPSAVVTTVTAQTLLQLLAKSLTDPELMRTLKELEEAHVGNAHLRNYSSMEGTPTPSEPDYLPHPMMQWFAQTTEEPNSVEEPLSFLPDEICTAHMKKPVRRQMHP